MVFQELWVLAMQIEMLDNRLVPRPHKHFVQGVPKVIRKAAPKVSSTKDQHFGLVTGRPRRRGRHFEHGWLDETIAGGGRRIKVGLGTSKATLGYQSNTWCAAEVGQQVCPSGVRQCTNCAWPKCGGQTVQFLI